MYIHTYYIHARRSISFVSVLFIVPFLYATFVLKLEPLAGCRKSPLYSRKAGTINRNGPMSLVTKIFQVLDFWQDMHFEVRMYIHVGIIT